MKKIDAVFSDLDGTWLNEHHQVPDENLQILQELKSRNIPFHIATGRAIDSIKTIKNLQAQGLTVCSNGAVIADLSKDEIIFENFVPRAAIEYLSEQAELYNLTAIWYTEDTVFVSRDDDYARNYFSVAGLHVHLEKLENFFDVPCRKIVLKDQDEVQLDILKNKLLERADLGVWGTYSLPNTLEVLNIASNKGEAVKQIAKFKGYNLENCVAFGDNHNDLQMLQTVGHGVAMENGRAEVVAQFTNRARPCSEGGVGLYLKKLLQELA